MSTSRPFKIVIFGASGFTGQYVVENLALYLNKNHSTLSWAVAARSESKLKERLKAVSSRTGLNLDSVPVMTADCEDPQSLDAITRQSTVLINCVGPFTSLGEVVVSSCIRNGCNYLDISGEPHFNEMIQLKYSEEAREKGVVVISSCGFDSVIADVGVNFIRDSFSGQLNSVETFLYSKDFKGNAASWNSAVEGFAQKEQLINTRQQLMEKEYEEVSRFSFKFHLYRVELRPVPPDLPDHVSGYAMPFGGSDRSVVRRTQMSNKLLYEEGMIQMEPYIIQDLVSSLWFSFLTWFSWIMKIPIVKNILLSYPEIFSLGRARKGGLQDTEVKQGSFQTFFRGVGWREGEDREKEPKAIITTQVSGPHPGYPTCAICVIQSALTVLEEFDKIPRKGVTTAGTAFRKTAIIQRLQENGIQFGVISREK